MVTVHQPKMKKIMDYPFILPHLLSLGRFLSKRLLQNLTELTSQFQVEHGALTPAPGPLWPGAVCLGHGLRTAGQKRALQQRTELQGLQHNSHKAVPALSSWKWTCTTPFTASPQQPNKGDKSRQLRNAQGKQHRVCGSLTWNSTLFFTLGPFLNSIK